MKLGIITALALALTTAACSKASLVTPPQFAAVDGSDYDFRATTAQGIVIAARTEKNKPEANLGFWTRAVDLRMKRDGYTAYAEKPFKTDAGLEGTQLRYTHKDAGRTMRYWLTVFATESKVYLVEAGGDEEDFAPAEAEIERAIRSLRTK